MDQAQHAMLSDAEMRELHEANECRAAFCRFLASLYLYELTDEQVESFALVESPDGDSAIDEGLRTMREYLRHRHGGTRQELAVDFARVFLGAGSYDRLTAPPYESVFTSKERILMQDARDGALTYYRYVGLDLPSENTVPEDHLGFELQFAALLAERANGAIEAGDGDDLCRLMELARSFFLYHQSNWVPRLCDAVDQFAATSFYHGVAQITRGYLESEEEFFAQAAQALALDAAVEELRPAWTQVVAAGDGSEEGEA